MNSADDRGNVVDIYVDDEPTGRLDREADRIEEIGDDTFAWEGGEPEMKVAIAEGYCEDVAIALLCGVIRGESDVKSQIIDFLKLAFDREEETV